MFLTLLKKDTRLVMSNPVLISLFTVLPLLIILIFGFSMKKFANADFDTFDGLVILYCEDGATDDIRTQFTDVSAQIAEKTGAEFKSTDSYDEAVRLTERSEAAGVIVLKSDGFEYFRSTFNEPYGGDIVRSLFVQMTSDGNGSSPAVASIDMGVKRTNAEVYYTFVGMIFSVMFMGSLVSSTYGRDIAANTLSRMSLSKAGNLMVLGSKLVCGLIFGIIQMLIALPIATVIFDIEWKHNILLILAVFCTVLVFSLAIGSVVGILIKNETLSYRTFCYIVLFSSYLGGAVTPVYLLKRIPVIRYLIKLSPVYWANESVISLYSGTVDERTTNCIAALLILSAVLISVNIIVLGKPKLFRKAVKEGDKE